MKPTAVSLLAVVSSLLLSCGGASSSSFSSAIAKEETFHFYCVNDFHGAVVEQRSNKGLEVGIAKYFGYLKQKKAQDPEHTVILSAGDMFQGSLESNSNYGKLIIEAMNNAGFDAMTVGNHEFDYGPLHFNDFVEWADFPLLGGNVMRYDQGPTKTPWNEQKIKASTVLNRGDIKIGVVGMIGEGQTTSITSKYVQDMTFVDPSAFAVNEAQRLREEEGCSLVVYALHDSYDNCRYYAANPNTFNGVFNGHTHQGEVRLDNKVPFLQGYCNGTSISHFDITLKGDSAKCTKYELISGSASWKEDEEIAAIRDSYLLDEDFQNKATAVAGHVNGELSPSLGIPNLISEAIYEKYKDVADCAMTNSSRASLTGDITYHDIYKSTPFLNHIVLAEVSGRDINREIAYNPCYSAKYESYENNETYTIAVIDYLLYHQDVNKRYDYFQSMNTNLDSRIVADYEVYPFDILFDYIHDNLGGVVNAADYN